MVSGLGKALLLSTSQIMLLRLPLAREPDWTKLARHDASQVPLEGLARQEELARLQQAIDDLPEPQREALILNKLEGLTYREMAQITGAPEGTLRSRVHWAMVVLRKRLGP